MFSLVIRGCRVIHCPCVFLDCLQRLSMQRLIAFSFLFFILGSGQQKPPTALLTQEQMVTILSDLELAKAVVGYYTDDEATASRLLQKNALLIYQAYDVAPEAFQKSYQYYFTQLEVMKEIYADVIKRLEELLSGTQSKLP